MAFVSYLRGVWLVLRSAPSSLSLWVLAADSLCLAPGARLWSSRGAHARKAKPAGTPREGGKQGAGAGRLRGALARESR